MLDSELHSTSQHFHVFVCSLMLMLNFETTHKIIHIYSECRPCICYEGAIHVGHLSLYVCVCVERDMACGI